MNILNENLSNYLLTGMQYKTLLDNKYYEINSPLYETAVTIKSSDNNESDLSFQQKLNNIDDLDLINKKMKEQKIKTHYNCLLDNIDSLNKECEEEGYEVFSEIAKITAKEVLYHIFCKFPDNEYFIYPTEEREIAIDCNPVDKRGVLILCDSNGGIACFVTIDGENSSFRDEKCSKFFYDFLWGSFKRIENTYYPYKIHDFSNIPKMHNSKYMLKSLPEMYQPVDLLSTAR